MFKNIARAALVLALAANASVVSAETTGNKVVKSTQAPVSLAGLGGLGVGATVAVVVGGIIVVGVIVEAVDNSSGSHGS